MGQVPEGTQKKASKNLDAHFESAIPELFLASSLITTINPATLGELLDVSLLFMPTKPSRRVK